LVIDDEEGIRDGLRSLLQSEGVAVATASGVQDARACVEQEAFDVVFLDMNIPGAEGLDLLPALRQGTSPADVIVLAGYGMASNTIEAMRRGASDVIEKPFTQDRILSVVRRCLEVRQLKNELGWSQARVKELASTELVGLSPAIREVRSRIDEIADSPDTAVLISGRSGTGKELAARCIHERSRRHQGPFVSLNCAAVTENLLEAELFGYEPGAFTGANRDGQEGLLSAAAGGTLFLDGIEGVAMTLQVKLARVLQERSYRKVGGVREISMDVRVVASASRDLRAEVEEGRFREDLFYRLNATPLHMPKLSDRSEDIPLLGHFFLDQIGRQMSKALSGFTEEAIETLCEYSWSGNVRELRNAIEHAAMVCQGGMIDEAHLPAFTGGQPDGSDTLVRGSLTLDCKDRSIRALEGQLVARVLDDTAWNISKAAAILGINRTTLYNKIRLHSLGHRPHRAKVNA